MKISRPLKVGDRIKTPQFYKELYGLSLKYVIIYKISYKNKIYFWKSEKLSTWGGMIKSGISFLEAELYNED